MTAAGSKRGVAPQTAPTGSEGNHGARAAPTPAATVGNQLLQHSVGGSGAGHAILQSSGADSLLDQIGARGAALGSNILLSSSLAPMARRSVLAHEITHVRQVGGRTPDGSRPLTGTRARAEEREADIAAAIGAPLQPKSRSADANTVRLFDRQQLIAGSITADWAKALDNAELDQAIQAISDHAATFTTSGMEADTAQENKRVLEAERTRRNSDLISDSAALTMARRPTGPPVIIGVNQTDMTAYVNVTPPGATLEDIAVYVYGSTARAVELGQLNGIVNGGIIAAGTTLKLAGGRQSAVFSQTFETGLKTGAMMRTEGVPGNMADNGMVYTFPGPSGIVQLTLGQFSSMLLNIRRLTRGLLKIHVDSIEFLLKLRNDFVEETNSVVRGISNYLGDVEVPGTVGYLAQIGIGNALIDQLDKLQMDADPRDTARTLNALQAQAVNVIMADEQLSDNWMHYIQGTTSGAEVAVSRLEVVRNVSFGIVAGMAGAIVAPAAFAALGAGTLGVTVTGTSATVLSLGGATVTGGLVRGGLEVIAPGAQADRPAGDRFVSGFGSGSVQGFTGGAGAFLTPVVSGGVTTQLATRYGQSFVQSTGGRFAANSITGTVVGAPSGAAGTALETLPAFARGDITGDQYASGIGWGTLGGGVMGAASPLIPVNGLYRSGGTVVTPKWMLAGPYSPVATVRGSTQGFNNLAPDALPAFADDPGVAGYTWAKVRSGGVDEWVPIRTYGPQQDFELAWYGDPANPSAGANFNLLYGPGGNPNALRLVGSRHTQLADGAGYPGLAANVPEPGMPRSTRTDYPMGTPDMEVTLPDGTTRPMIRGHNVDHFDTTSRTAQIPDSNLDIRNFTPEPPQWGTLSGRNRVTTRARTANLAGGTEFRQVNMYGDAPAVTASGKPVPREIYFVEMGAGNVPARAWRIRFDDPNAFAGINMHRVADIDANFSVNPSTLPNAVQIDPLALPASVLAAAIGGNVPGQ